MLAFQSSERISLLGSKDENPCRLRCVARKNLLSNDSLGNVRRHAWTAVFLFTSAIYRSMFLSSLTCKSPKKECSESRLKTKRKLASAWFAWTHACFFGVLLYTR